MAPHDAHPADEQPPEAQRPEERALQGGDVASQALHEALRVSFRLLKVAMVLVAVLFLLSGVFIVKEEEQAFVLRFGRLVRDAEGQALLGPGLHFAWPFLIDEVVRVPVQRKFALTIEDFWYTGERTARGQPLLPSLKPGRSGYTLTGDANILHTAWSIEYRVAEPVRFFRHLGDPAAIEQLESDGPEGTVPQLLRSLLASAVVRTLATFRVDDALGGQRRELEKGVEDELRRELGRLDVGLTITKFTLDKIAVPLQTQAAFDEVNSAVYRSQTLKDQARAYATEITTRATSEGDRRISEAKSYKTRVIERAKADAAYMDSLLQEYPEDPRMLSLFLEQRLTEVLEDVLQEADEVFVLDPGEGPERTEIRLHINRDPRAVKENILRRRRERQEARDEAGSTAPTEAAP